MKSWTEASAKPPYQTPPKTDNALYYDLERYLFETDPKLIKEPYREMFLSIKTQYLEGKPISPKQVKAVRTCWRIAEDAEDEHRNQGRGISAKSFRGLPRVVNEGIY